MAAFSDTTNKNGLIQIYEFWTRQQDGSTTGTSLKQATSRINAGFERIMPILLAYNDQIRWDDLNHTDAPIGYVNLVANQNDYKITADDNSLDILNITKVRIKTTSAATLYTELERITADDPRVAQILSPDTSVTGLPSAFLELSNRIYLDVLPNVSVTNGIEIFFGREQSYFVSTDTTKEPGIPKPFHELLALYAALDWNRVNRTDDPALIRELKEEIAKQEYNLKTFINMQNPARAGITNRRISFR
jgi:hypothetical protein